MPQMMDYKAVLAQMDDMKRAPWLVVKRTENGVKLERNPERTAGVCNDTQWAYKMVLMN